MKKTIIFVLCVLSVSIYIPAANAQTKLFTLAVDRTQRKGSVTCLVQDRQGYIWFGCNTNGGTGGLYRYGGTNTISYLHDPEDSNSLGNNWVETLCIDSAGIIWIGTHGTGLDRLDPVTKTFTHFSYDPKDSSSIANDNVNALLVDHLGNLWIGTNAGLDKMDRTTGQFTHYKSNLNDASTISDNMVRVIYEDIKGNLWVGCGSPFPGEGTPESGGLNLFHPATGKFTRYLHDPDNPKSISNNKITAIYEDSEENLWIGTGDNGLQILNRNTGVFTHFPYDPEHPDKFSTPPLTKKTPVNFNFISFIQEDAAGNLWIGTTLQGIQKYDPRTKKVTRYGFMYQQPGKRVAADTASGFTASYAWHAFKVKNGLLWIPVGNGRLFYVNPLKENIPYYAIKQSGANAFYQDEKGGFWLATDEGLLYKPAHGKEKLYVHDPHNLNSLAGNAIAVMLPDKKGNLWLGTYPGAGRGTANGLDKFDLSTGTFTHYKDSGMLKGNGITSLFLDDNGQSLWVGSGGGLYKLNTQTGKFIHHYINDIKDSNSLSNNIVYALMADGNKLWAGTNKGLNLLNKKNGQWKPYLPASTILGLYKDAAGVLWTGTSNGLFRYDSTDDHFNLYTDPATGIGLGNVLNIIEDNNNNLWVSCADAIYRINAGRDTIHVYGHENGVHPNTFLLALNYKARDGKLFLGDQGGYYAFYPDSLNNQWIKPVLNISGFKLGSKEVLPGKNSPLKVPVSLAKNIELKHDQNSFSFAFSALHYANPGEEHYRYMLENYDTAWHDIGAKNQVYFFNMPPGHYTFKVRAVNPNGAWSEKDMAVIINPPWWTTWWAIVIFILILIAIVWTIIYVRSRKLKRENRILEEKVNHRTEQLKKSLDDLKSTQKQLIQSEKMASLGELTAGIAHEIQNPLNFVNNFSEVSIELANELKEDFNKLNVPAGEKENMELIIHDLIQNQEKINFHGKRADAIVKGMLQHSRGSSGQRQPTDINALADEYLRLSYHGLRAKDKFFNATMKTDFDETLSADEAGIGKINIVPQDMGRVLLNLINNAFYACTQKSQMLKAESQKLKAQLTTDPSTSLSAKRQFGPQAGSGQTQPITDNGYSPTVWVCTKKEDGYVIIKVKDNGNGIPQKALNKIFQPFFTTKPTGEGTGLGLSLSYEIIKVHDGEIKVNTKEGEGTEFIVKLPVT